MSTRVLDVEPRASDAHDVHAIYLRVAECGAWQASFGPDVTTRLLASVRHLATAFLSEQGVEHCATDEGFDTVIVVDGIDDGFGTGLGTGDVSALAADLAASLARHRARCGDLSVRFTPAVGFGPVPESSAPGDVDLGPLRRAAAKAGEHRDLRPVRGDAAPVARRSPLDPLRRLLGRGIGWAVGLSLVLGIVVPFLIYAAVWTLTGFDLAPYVYAVVTAGVLVTATTIYIEALRAIAPAPVPAAPAGPPAPASVIIAAYLPNEIGTVAGTVAALLDQEYAGPLQVILAYNTPEPMPIEADLARWADSEPRLTVLRVAHSRSKAANVNAAMELVQGDFVGIFDADHLPNRGVVTRAGRWIADGADIVQGRCSVRNGHASGVARMVAVEFEQMYGLSHPGRARVHGFGIFGGSNGFWRTDLLHHTRMECRPLTEDIDATIRALSDTQLRIVSDPAMVSWELAPTTLSALAHQRTRWSQGWTEVSLRHLRAVTGSLHLSRRQRAGAAVLFGWRELFPWIGLQALPLVAYEALLRPDHKPMHWFLPLFVVFGLYAVGVNVAQGLLAWRLAVPEMRRRRRWFLRYTFLSCLWYAEWKACIARACHVRHAFGISEWTVTSRVAPVPAPTPAQAPAAGLVGTTR